MRTYLLGQGIEVAIVGGAKLSADAGERGTLKSTDECPSEITLVAHQSATEPAQGSIGDCGPGSVARKQSSRAADQRGGGIWGHNGSVPNGYSTTFACVEPLASSWRSRDRWA